jgi:hypothetical protein
LELIEDPPTCKDAIKALMRCALAHETCTADGKMDFDSIAAGPCAKEATAYEKCAGATPGDGGTH